jgi:hypothetical protein
MVIMSSLSVVRVVMMMRGRIHRHFRCLMVVNAQFLVVSRTRWPTQHCGRNRAADGQQYGKQYQEPDAKRSH